MDMTKHSSKAHCLRGSYAGPLQKFRQYARSITSSKERKDTSIGPPAIAKTIHVDASKAKEPALLQPIPQAFGSPLPLPAWVRYSVLVDVPLRNTESISDGHPFTRDASSTRSRVASVNSPLPLSDAFRGTIYSDDSRSETNIRSSPKLSPRFMKPRLAPRPPRNNDANSGISFDMTDSEIPSFAAREERGFLQCTLTVPSMPSSPEHIQGPRPSTESGLERIGAALLDCDQFETRSLNDASHSSLIGSAGSAQSLSAVFDALEEYGINARNILDDEPERDSPSLSCSMSAPASLVVDSPCPVRSAMQRYHRISKGMEMRDSLRVSFSSTVSNLEILLQNQGIDTPSSKRLVELWTAMARQSIRPSRSRDTTKLPVVKEVSQTDQHPSEGREGDVSMKETSFVYEEEHSVAPDGSVGVAL